MEKVTVNGQVMWQSSDGVRRKQPEVQPSKVGWHRVTVDGREMWESPEGEREF